MTKSYKMVLLRALLRRGELPGELAIDDLTDAFATEAARNQYLRDDVSVDIADRGKLRRLIIGQPIKAWTGTQGAAGESFFEFGGGVFRCNLEIPDDHREAFAELVREMVEWRLAAYLDRARGGDRIVCKVSHSNDRPILFLPDRDKEEGIPWGNTPVDLEGVAHEADFVKIAVNVVRQQGSNENVLPSVLRGWFGQEAGQSGTTHKVTFVRTQEGFRLEPLLAATGPELWKTYMREEIPPLFGLEFSMGLWQQGFIRKDGHIFLLVTLEKSGLQQEFQYEDRFLSATEFQWQSQNQTARDSTAGRAIQRHKAEGTQVHLFVRPTKLRGGKAAPFYYCGELQFVSWEGDKPITVQWTVGEDIPLHLRSSLRLT